MNLGISELSRFEERRIETEFFRVKTLPQLLDALESLGIFKDHPSVRERLQLKAWEWTPWIRLVRGFGFQIFSLHMGSLQPTALNFKSSMWDGVLKVPKPILAAWEEGRPLDASIPGYETWKNQAKFQRSWDIAQRAMSIYWISIATQWVVQNDDLVKKTGSVALSGLIHLPGWIRTAWSARHLDVQEIKEYEAKTYDPKQVIQEQYQLWLDSFDGDTPPSEEDKREELELLTQWEREGKLRITH